MSAATDESRIGGEPVEAGTGRRSLDPGFKRNLKIIGGVFVAAVVLVGFMVVRASGSKEGPAPRSALEVGTAQSQQADNLTPAMKEKLAKKQAEEAKQAAASGDSYIPPDPPAAAQPISVQGPAYAGPSSLSVGTAPVTQYASNLNTESDTRRREGLQRQLAALMGEGAGGEGNLRARVMGGQREEAARNAASAGAAAAASAPAAASPTPAASPREIVAGLSIHAGQLTSDISIAAGSSGFASARIVGGPASGAFLVGQARVTNESLEIAFNQMSLGGKVYRIDAIVLDEATASNALSANVDRRLLQRYVLPIALAMAQGYFTAKSQTGSTLVALGAGDVVGAQPGSPAGGSGGSGSNGVVVAGVQTPPPSAEQARSAGIAQGLQLASTSVQREAALPVVVSRERSATVGILFRAPVVEEVR